VDGLELSMCKARLDDRRRVAFDDEFLEVTQHAYEFVQRRWDEARGTRTRSPNPVLCPPEFPGILVSAATTTQRTASFRTYI
jgi:hypothetical protein